LTLPSVAIVHDYLTQRGGAERVVLALHRVFPDAPIFVCEGEKDVERLEKLELCATTVANGNWDGVDVSDVADRDVIVLEDADATGVKKALTAAASLKSVAKTVRVVRLPGQEHTAAKHGKDVSDWLDEDAARGGEELFDLCIAAPLWDPYAAPSALGEWDAGEVTTKPPPREWLLGNVFARTFMSSLLADGGVGKTAVRIAQLISLALGRSLTDEHVFQRCRVLIVSLEDDKHELERRVEALLLHHGIDRSELTGWLFLSAPGGACGKIMTADKRGNMTSGPLREAIEKTIVARKIDIVSVDPFVKSHQAEENDNNAIDEVVQTLTDMAIAHNIALDAPHHTSKGASDPGNANRGRGASAMKDGARLVYTLNVMSPDEAKAFGISEEHRKFYIRMDSAKVNIAPPMGRAKWFKLVGVRLDNGNEKYPGGDEVQAAEPWSPPETWADLDSGLLNRMLTEIDAGLKDGSRYTDHNVARERAAWKVVLKHAPGKSEAQAREVIRTWVKNGVLENRDYHNPVERKERRGLYVDPDKRPDCGVRLEGISQGALKAQQSRAP
jgi:5S rRNA maturation endonuclease (ribonuclease M5)